MGNIPYFLWLIRARERKFMATHAFMCNPPPMYVNWREKRGRSPYSFTTETVELWKWNGRGEIADGGQSIDFSVPRLSLYQKKKLWRIRDTRAIAK